MLTWLLKGRLLYFPPKKKAGGAYRSRGAKWGEYGSCFVHFYTNGSILNMDLLFRQRQRRIFFTNVPFLPLSVGNKIYRPLSFCSEWGEIPYKTGATCLPWVASRMLEKGILVVEGSPGISSFATHYFGPGFR